MERRGRGAGVFNTFAGQRTRSCNLRVHGVAQLAKVTHVHALGGGGEHTHNPCKRR